MIAERTPEEERESWDRVAKGFDELTTPRNIGFSDNALSHTSLRPGMYFLDVASGSGALSIAAARRGARVLASDLSPVMIELLKARAHSEKLENLDGRVMDGRALDLEDDTFDMAGSMNGVSLFPDADKGLSEMVRVTKPDGEVMIIAFGPMEKTEFPNFFFRALQSAAPDVPVSPPEGNGGPFQMADSDLMASRMVNAGLKGVRVRPMTWTMEFKSSDEFWDTITHSNPIGEHMIGTLTSEQQTAVRKAVQGMLAQRAGGSGSTILTSEMNLGVGKV